MRGNGDEMNDRFDSSEENKITARFRKARECKSIRETLDPEDAALAFQ
jgi:hypothetical protein